MDYHKVVEKFTAEKKKFVDTVKVEWKKAADEWEGDRKTLEATIARLERKLEQKDREVDEAIA